MKENCQEDNEYLQNWYQLVVSKGLTWKIRTSEIIMDEETWISVGRAILVVSVEIFSS